MDYFNKDHLSDVLEGFKKLKIKIVLTNEDIIKLTGRAKLKNYFDAISVGFIHSGFFKEKQNIEILKPNGIVFAETA